jgi:hypothetical protein
MSMSTPMSTPIVSPRRPRRRTRANFTLGATAAACSIALALGPLVPAHASFDPPRTGGDVPERSTSITTTVTDGDDTYGPLDISRVTHRITYTTPRGRVRLDYAVKTYRPFDAGALDPRQRRFVIELDTDGRSGAERNVRISARSGEPTADVISNATRKVIATVDVTRPNAQTLRITGPRRLIGAQRYFWYSDFHADHSRHCGWNNGYPVTCQDDVPEQGWIRLDSPAWPRDPDPRA